MPPPPENWQNSEKWFHHVLDRAGVDAAGREALAQVGVTTVAAWDDAPASVFGTGSTLLSDEQFNNVTAVICEMERACENVELQETGAVLRIVLEEAGVPEAFPLFEARALMHPSQLTSLVAADAVLECVGGDEEAAERVLDVARLYEEEARSLLAEEDERRAAAEAEEPN
uniref:Uncharacterized protein n=1 Tax=Neobodo designis TaxID=312471 RepID=A0A7S1QUF3_NEODS|mmetsp:Transcript_52553/g.161753  ORF Transcript_52553/g.161753 Transcript_52553/m.161753 type:complete len:171 (+) Transcript_52553:56-568(+)